MIDVCFVSQGKHQTLDYFFLNRRGHTDILTVLNFLHHPSGASLVRCCASGCDIHGSLATQELFAKRWEPASGAPAQAIKIARNDEMQLETTPRYSTSSLCAVDRSNRSVEGQIRCMRISLEKSADKSFGVEDNILVWLCQHAGWLITRFHAQTDGLTPYQRLEGKPYSGELAELGGQVYVKDPILRHAKLDDRWIGPVTWIGKADRGDQHMTVLTNGRALELY